MPRVLVVGIDGAPPALVRRWMADGELPTLARLREDGVFGTLRSTPNMTSPSAWTSIATGVNPGRHGIVGFFDRLPGSYRFRQSSALARRAPPWWVLASEAGLRVATLNMPCSWPADEVNGVMVAGWLTPADDAPGFTWPAELAAEIRGRFGAYPLHSDVARLVARGRHRAARERIVGNLRRKAQIAAELLAREPFDLLSVVFADTDAAEHYYLHLADPAHPEHDPALLARVGDPVLAAYREVDRGIEEILRRVGDLDAVLVISDHGAGASYRGELFLPGLLDALGWQSRGRGMVRRITAALRGVLPAGLTHRLADMARRSGRDWASEMLVGDVRWEHTRAFTALSGGRADLSLNVRGREPQGVIDAGCTAEAVEELRTTLLAAEDPALGTPAIAELPHRSDLYEGPHVELAPDLLVRWSEEAAPLSGLRCDGVAISRPEERPLQTGAHRPDGLVIAAGRGIAHGEVAASVYDVAPTVLHLCGLPVPAYCDGEVVAGIFAQAPDVRVDHEARPSDGLGGTATADGRVAERLRGLGYL